MKTKNIIILTLIIAFLGCQKDSPLPNLQETATNKTDILLRPDALSGESFGKTILKSASITDDLTTITAEDLAHALLGTGPNTPTISNVTFTGAPTAAGLFEDLTDVFGFEKGIVLSSGNIGYIQGPNTSDEASMNNGLPGDADLNGLIPGYSTNDATVLEFDFECQYLQYISFQYVFSSEEYNEWIGSSYNDVFGFFVNGVNIALIPETTTPVSVNNLNCGNPYGSADNHCILFNNNDLSDGGSFFDTEMDGFTVILTATTAVNPGVNHIKLAIADAGDYVLDSDVLIKGESFVCAPPVLPVDIDIKPGGEPNSINCKNTKEVITVAILTTESFDALMVDHETVMFEGAQEMHIQAKTGKIQRHKEDVDLDGDMDLVFHFILSQTSLDCISTEGTLMGELFDGTPIVGTDGIRMLDVPMNP